ncbi:hypothetical protein [Mycobacterium malmoense]|nr:hypothetical protein [Mycobacterium malmoense]
MSAPAVTIRQRLHNNRACLLQDQPAIDIDAAQHLISSLTLTQFP